MKDLKINSSATKKDIIEQYEKLLNGYKKKVKDADEAHKRVTEVERKLASKAGETAREATVASVIGAIGELRGQVSATLNDLTDKMSAQAEKLEGLGRAIEVQEQRLQELYDIEVTADTLNKLTAAYAERKSETEASYAAMLEELEKELESTRRDTLAELEEERTVLESTIQAQRAKWGEDKAREKKAWEEEKAEQSKDREREEAEYIYERDRERKLEQDDYQERKSLQEKVLKESADQAEKDLAQREATLVEREQSIDALESQVAVFPKRLEEAVTQAKQELAERVGEKSSNDARLKAVERDWEKKMFGQKIEHLEQVIAGQESKIAGLTEELRSAQKQVNEVAKKAIEGASLNRAFQSVNKIALEQAKHHEGEKSVHARS